MYNFIKTSSKKENKAGSSMAVNYLFGFVAVFTFFLFLISSFSLIQAEMPSPTPVDNSELVITKYDGVEAETYLPTTNGNQLCLYHKAGNINVTDLEELKQLIQEAQDNVDNWTVGISYLVGDLVSYEGQIYKVLQAHTSQADWTPDIVPSLFVEYAFQDIGKVPQWTQPAGGHDAYNLGDRVWFQVNEDKLIYESVINANVWSPISYPAGWDEIGIINEQEVYGNESIEAVNELGNSIVVPRGLEEGLSTYCVNVTQSIQIGENTIIAEMINDTDYDYPTSRFNLNGIEITFFCVEDGVKTELTYENGFNIRAEDILTDGVKFDLITPENFTCNGSFISRQNVRNIPFTIWNNQYGGKNGLRFINYSDFETSPDNNITGYSESSLSGWNDWWYCVGQDWTNVLGDMEECMNTGVNKEWTGYFTDFDPSPEVTYTSSSDLIGNGSDVWRNQTNATNLGVSLQINDSAWELYDGNKISPYMFDSGHFNSLVFYNSTSTYWNTTLSLADSNGSAEVYDLCNSDANCVSYWELETLLKDTMGQHVGYPAGGVIINKSGIIGNALALDGINDYITIDDHANWTFNTGGQDDAFSGSAWIKMDDATHFKIVTKWDADAPSREYSFEVDTDDKLRLILWDESADKYIRARSDSTLTSFEGEWVHVGFRYDGSESQNGIDLFINGSEVASVTRDTNTGYQGMEDLTVNINLGRFDTNFAEGLIDEVGIWTTELTDQDFSDLYNSGNGNHPNIVLGNLMAEYRMDERTIANQDSKGSNHGSIGVSRTYSATGVSSGAMRFNGSDDYIIVDSLIEDIEDNTGGSISFWVSPDDFVTSTVFGTGRASSVNWASRVQLIDNKCKFSLKSTSTDTWEPDITINADEWSHCLIQSNGSKIEIYVNGVKSTVTKTGSTFSEGSWFNDLSQLPDKACLGTLCQNGGQTTYFTGELDEFLIYNDSLTASEVESLYKAGLSQHANTNITLETRTADSYNISDGDLMGFYAMNNASVGSLDTIPDESNRENDMTFASGGDTVFNEGNGTVGLGAFFDGGDDSFLYVTDTSDHHFETDDFAVSLWFNTYSTNANYRWLVEKDKSDSSQGFNLAVVQSDDGSNPNKLRWNIRGGSGASIYSDNTVTDNTWHHVIALRESGTIKLYVDGELQSDTASATGNVTETSSLFVGCYYTSGCTSNSEFHGSIDEVRIYNDSLSADEIQNLYELGSYHIEWNDWKNQSILEDGVAQGSTNYGKFFQTRFVYNTNDTDVSPYVLNHSIGVGSQYGVVGDTTSPTITWETDSSLTGTYAMSNIIQNFSLTDETQLANITHYLNYSNGTNINITTYSISGTSNTSRINFTNLNDDDYVSYGIVCDTSNNCNQSTYQNITIQNLGVTVVYPVNGNTYTQTTLDLNYTVTGNNLESCWYSTDGGTTNSSAVAYGTNFSVTGSEGSNTWTVYCNNTNSDERSDSTTFTIDLPPTVNIINPTTADQNLVFEFEMSCSDTQGVENQWYSWKGTNYTYTSALDLYASAGAYPINAWCNDTYGNVDSDSVSFTARDLDTNATTGCPDNYYLDGDGDCVLFPTCNSSAKLSYNGTDWSCVTDLNNATGSGSTTGSTRCYYQLFGKYDSSIKSFARMPYGCIE